MWRERHDLLHSPTSAAYRPQNTKHNSEVSEQVRKLQSPASMSPKGPDIDAPPHSPLIELPAELLHNVFASLDLRDVLAARKSCSTLASIGLDYLGDEVPLVYHRDKFKALTAIA